MRMPRFGSELPPKSGSTGDVATATVTSGALRQVERFLDRATFLLDLLLQQGNGIDQLLGTRRAPGNIHVNGDNLIHTLNQGIVLEYAA